MKTKLRALVGGVALLLVLAAWYPGVSSQVSQGYEIQATITKGKVNLNHSLWNSGSYYGGYLNPHGYQGDFGYYRSTDEGNGTATVDLKFSNSKGNWQVSGKWIDGPVKMEFTGRSEYLEALTANCLSDFTFTENSSDYWYYEVQGNNWAYNYGAKDCNFVEAVPGYVESIPTSDWMKGGCVTIPTLYRSLNSSLVGTGHALILVCQNGGWMGNSWSNPSYIEVWIPDTTIIDSQAIGDLDVDVYGDDFWDEYGVYVSFEDSVYYAEGYFQPDNSPFRNYYAGGVNTNRSGKWTVQTRYNSLLTSPMPTESPLFSYWWDV